MKPIDPRAVPAPVASPLRAVRRIILELVLLTMIAVLAPARSWEVLASFMRQHPLIRAEIIALGLTAIALWVRRVDIRGFRNRIGAAALDRHGPNKIRRHRRPPRRLIGRAARPSG